MKPRPVAKIFIITDGVEGLWVSGGVFGVGKILVPMHRSYLVFYLESFQDWDYYSTPPSSLCHLLLHSLPYPS
jgi:hypothetical protein